MYESNIAAALLKSQTGTDRSLTLGGAARVVDSLTVSMQHHSGWSLL